MNALDDTLDQTLDRAIREQLARLDRRLEGGMARAGWKICVNDRRMQKKLGLEACFVGSLDGSKALRGDDAWSVRPGAILGVEPEFAVRFATAVAPGDDPAAIRAAVRGVAPAIEVVDWRGASFELHALAAGSSFHAGFVVGELRALDAVPALGGDCPRFRRGDAVLGVPDPDLVPADLTGLIADVAAFLARHGRRIEADDWLLCGACTNPARVEAGDEVEADFGSLGSVRVRFVG